VRLEQKFTKKNGTKRREYLFLFLFTRLKGNESKLAMRVLMKGGGLVILQYGLINNENVRVWKSSRELFCGFQKIIRERNVIIIYKMSLFSLLSPGMRFKMEQDLIVCVLYYLCATNWKISPRYYSVIMTMFSDPFFVIPLSRYHLLIKTQCFLSFSAYPIR